MACLTGKRWEKDDPLASELRGNHREPTFRIFQTHPARERAAVLNGKHHPVGKVLHGDAEMSSQTCQATGTVVAVSPNDRRIPRIRENMPTESERI